MHSIGATFVRLPSGKDLWVVARANLDWIAAALAGLHLYLFREEVVRNFATGGAWDIGAFYAAAFDWSSIQAAFLFGVYAFFLSRSEPFLQAIAPSAAFKLLRRYVVRTLYMSMGITVVTLPMLVAKPGMDTEGDGFAYMIFWLVSVMLTYTFFCFLRVVRVFGKIERRS